MLPAPRAVMGIQDLDGSTVDLTMLVVTRRHDACVGEATAVCCRDFLLARAGADRKVRDC